MAIDVLADRDNGTYTFATVGVHRVGNAEFLSRVGRVERREVRRTAQVRRTLGQS